MVVIGVIMNTGCIKKLDNLMMVKTGDYGGGDDGENW